MDLDSENQSLEMQTEEFGVDVFIQRRTLRILNKTDESKGGTGVTVRLGDRFFVVTAEHVIRGEDNLALLLRDNQGSHYDDFVAKHTCKRADVGVLELNPQTAPTARENHEYLRDQDLYRSRYPHASRSIWIVGYPGNLIRTRRVSGSKLIAYQTLSYGTNTIPQSEWPDLQWPNRSNLRGRELYCSFDPDLERINRQYLGSMDAMKSYGYLDALPLYGMSGGGMWLPMSLASEETGLWQPTAELAGIQTGYPGEGKGQWLRGTRITALLELIRKHYPNFSSSQNHEFV